jgi:hypothetical protein
MKGAEKKRADQISGRSGTLGGRKIFKQVGREYVAGRVTVGMGGIA